MAYPIIDDLPLMLRARLPHHAQEILIPLPSGWAVEDGAWLGSGSLPRPKTRRHAGSKPIPAKYAPPMMATNEEQAMADEAPTLLIRVQRAISSDFSMRETAIGLVTGMPSS